MDAESQLWAGMQAWFLFVPCGLTPHTQQEIQIIFYLTCFCICLFVWTNLNTHPHQNKMMFNNSLTQCDQFDMFSVLSVMSRSLPAPSLPIQWSARHRALLKSDSDPFIWIRCLGLFKWGWAIRPKAPFTSREDADIFQRCGLSFTPKPCFYHRKRLFLKTKKWRFLITPVMCCRVNWEKQDSTFSNVTLYARKCLMSCVRPICLSSRMNLAPYLLFWKEQEVARVILFVILFCLFVFFQTDGDSLLYS